MPARSPQHRSNSGLRSWRIISSPDSSQSSRGSLVLQTSIGHTFPRRMRKCILFKSPSTISSALSCCLNAVWQRIPRLFRPARQHGAFSFSVQEPAIPDDFGRAPVPSYRFRRSKTNRFIWRGRNSPRPLIALLSSRARLSSANWGSPSAWRRIIFVGSAANKALGPRMEDAELPCPRAAKGLVGVAASQPVKDISSDHVRFFFAAPRPRRMPTRTASCLYEVFVGRCHGGCW